MTFIPRILGAATAAYGLAALLRPRILARPVAMVEADGSLGPAIRVAAGLIGSRLAVGGWMTTAPAGAPLRTAIIARALFDAGDAVLFGALAPTRPAASRHWSRAAGRPCVR